MLVLDTSVMVEIERGNAAVAAKLEHFRAAHTGNLAVSAAVYAEVLCGFLAVGRPEAGERFLEQFILLEFDKESARCCASVKRKMDANGKPIPVFDLITASCALSRGATVVTTDRHFEAVPELKTVFL